MATQVQIIRGTTAENDAFTGADGALTYDTQKKQLRVHDGATAGGKIINDIVTSIDDTNTDNQIPSAKAVYDELEAKQSTANLVTSMSAASTDSQYPSAKLLYDTCGDIETLINAL